MFSRNKQAIAIATSSLAMVAVVPHAQAPSAEIATQPFTVSVSIVAKHSGKCLDVTAGSLFEGARLQQWGCNGLPQQRFWLAAVGAYFKIITFDGRVLDVSNESRINGAPIIQWGFVNGANQLW